MSNNIFKFKQDTISAVADKDIGPNRERMEDYSAVDTFTTEGGLSLMVAMVCDGVGGSEWGELAARLTADNVIEYMRGSDDTLVPRLIDSAIRYANEQVYRRGNDGSSTIALLVVHDDGSQYGRLYVGSVGDSGLYLIRNDELKRLNTDHTVGQDAVWRGQSPDIAYQQQGATHLTRAMGIAPDVEPDFGIYANAEGPADARKRGMVGIELQEGDTIFACSDGLTDPSRDDQKPYVGEKEFLHHAMDYDVERTASTYLGYALGRNTHDNVSIALVFVESPKRKNRAVLGTKVPKSLLVAVPVLVLVVVIFFFMFLQSSGEASEARAQLEDSQRTQTRVAADGTATQIAISSFTPTPSLTPTQTSTPRPTFAPDQVGIWQREGDRGNSSLIVEGETIREPGLLALELGNPVDALFYIEGMAEILEANEQRIRYLLDRDSTAFVMTTADAQREIEIEPVVDANLRFFVQGSCMSIQHESDGLVATCYEGNCSYQLQRNTEPEPIPPGQAVRISSSNQAPLIQSVDVESARYFQSYTDRIALPSELIGQTCISTYIPTPTPTLPPATRTPRPSATPEESVGDADNFTVEEDQDRDGVPNELDACDYVAGPAAFDGCPPPDSDGDGIGDHQDACPNILNDNFGDPCNPDEDGDGTPDEQDSCPADGAKTSPGACGCGTPDADEDGDGVLDCDDACPQRGNEGHGLQDNGCPNAPPTEVPPTPVPPTEVPPTEVPPTEVPPTEVPPTEVPPTEVPPTEVPPTDVPPTDVPPPPAEESPAEEEGKEENNG